MRKCDTDKKGQGMVEYAFVMSFVVILAAAVFTVDYRDAVITIFNKVAVALSQ